MDDFWSGVDTGRSETKVEVLQRRVTMGEVENLCHSYLVSGNVAPISRATYDDSVGHIEDNGLPAFGTGVLCSADKNRIYGIGAQTGRTANNVPKWQTAVWKILAVLAAIERRDGGSKALNGTMRFTLPRSQIAFAKPMAAAIRAEVKKGFWANGRFVNRIGELKMMCSIEGSGLVRQGKGVYSAALLTGHADISFVLAYRGDVVPDSSFVLDGAGAIQLLRLAELPGDELNGARLLALGDYESLAVHGLRERDVVHALEVAQKKWTTQNQELLAEIGSILARHNLDSVIYAGGSCELFRTLLSKGLSGIELISPDALLDEYGELFGAQSDGIRFADLHGIWRQIPEVREHLEGGRVYV